MPRTKVTRNRQVTIPSEIAGIAHISEGDILDVTVVGQDVVLRKTRDELPLIRIGKKITDVEIERLISEAAREISG
jgi:AbrB family looped-hinge helix DNA binding protein